MFTTKVLGKKTKFAGLCIAAGAVFLAENQAQKPLCISEIPSSSAAPSSGSMLTLPGVSALIVKKKKKNDVTAKSDSSDNTHQNTVMDKILEKVKLKARSIGYQMGEYGSTLARFKKSAQSSFGPFDPLRKKFNMLTPEQMQNIVGIIEKLPDFIKGRKNGEKTKQMQMSMMQNRGEKSKQKMQKKEELKQKQKNPKVRVNRNQQVKEQQQAEAMSGQQIKEQQRQDEERRRQYYIMKNQQFKERETLRKQEKAKEAAERFQKNKLLWEKRRQKTKEIQDAKKLWNQAMVSRWKNEEQQKQQARRARQQIKEQQKQQVVIEEAWGGEEDPSFASENDDECVICYEATEGAYLPNCYHPGRMCRVCLEDATEKNHECPQCRAPCPGGKKDILSDEEGREYKNKCEKNRKKNEKKA